MLEIGTKAPDFNLSDQNGEMKSLLDYRGQKVILYFYPKDMTAGCTKQACAFGELKDGKVIQKGVYAKMARGEMVRYMAGIQAEEPEYDAALATGLYDTIIFGYDEWFNNQMIKLSVVPEEETIAIYRGWMMKPEEYTEFYRQLSEQNVRLITTPEMYSLMHLFPNIYSKIERDTERIRTFPLHAQIDIEECICSGIIQGRERRLSGGD